MTGNRAPRSESPQGYFVAGGTLPADAPSYVERAADAELLARLSQGDYCYILTARQMGKSSLMVRTAAKLREHGVAVAVLDVSAIGSHVTPEQWYEGLVVRLSEQLGLEPECEEYWAEHQHLGPLQRCIAAVRQVVMQQLDGEVVIFIDEVDAVARLPFQADELFAGIRECYNRRPLDPVMRRLTFCLIGVSTPSDLIADSRTTPFNIGHRIELNDFTATEAMQLAVGISPSPAPATALLNRILYWTGGHPYLTQRLCRAMVADGPVTATAELDRIVDELLLSRRARETDSNLTFVRDRILRLSGDAAGTLELYRLIHRGRRVSDDPADPRCNLLRLSGLTRVRDGCHQVRNRIYHRVFDLRWVAENLSPAELLRQRRAFRRGLLRVLSVAVPVVMVLAASLSMAVRERRQADQRLAALLAQKAEECAGTGDLGGAMVYSCEGLALQAREPHRVPIHQARLRALADAMPRLIGLWHHDSLATCAALAPGGRYWAAGYRDGAVLLADLGAPDAPARSVQLRQAATSLTFADDGRALAIGTCDRAGETGALMLWALGRHGGSVKELLPATPIIDVRAVADQTLVAATRRGEVRFLQLPNGREFARGTFDQEVGGVRVLAVSPDRRMIATCSATGEVMLWSAGGERLAVLKVGAPVHRSTFSHSGKLMAVSVNRPGGMFVQLWNVETLTPVGMPMPHEPFSPANDLSFTADDGQLVSVSMDGQLRVWKVPEGLLQRAVQPSSFGLNSLCLSPDGTQLITASEDRTARVWSTVDWEQALPALNHGGSVTGVAFAGDGRRLVTAAIDGTLRLYDQATARTPTSPVERWHSKGFYSPSLSWSADGSRVATCAWDNTSAVWDGLTGDLIGQPMACGSRPDAVALSRDGSLLAVEHQRYQPDDKGAMHPDYVVSLWSVGTTNRWLADLPNRGHSGVRELGFADDGKQLVTRNAAGLAHRWDLAAMTRPTVCGKGLSGDRIEGAVSADGRYAVVGDASRYTIYELETGRTQLAEPPNGRPADELERVQMVVMSPDGRAFFDYTSDGWIGLWDARTGALRNHFRGHEAGLQRGLFDRTSQRFATFSQDRTARLWNARTGELMAPPMRHDLWVLNGDFSPDGRWLATVTHDYQLQFWDTVTGDRLPVSYAHPSLMYDVEWSPDGTRVATLCSDGALRIWRFPTDNRSLADWQALAELLSGRAMVHYPRAGIRLLEPLDGGTMARRWQELRQRYSEQFSVSPQQVLGWHATQAQALEYERPAAAATHLEALGATAPGNEHWLRSRAIQALLSQQYDEFGAALREYALVIRDPALRLTLDAPGLLPLAGRRQSPEAYRRYYETPAVEPDDVRCVDTLAAYIAVVTPEAAAARYHEAEELEATFPSDRSAKLVLPCLELAAGQAPRAMSRLQTLLGEAADGGLPMDLPTARALLLLALAARREGQPALAQTCERRARGILAALPPDKFTWATWIETEELLNAVRER